jgi:hypothetical protein
MTHVCNSGYTEGRDQEDRGSKPALVKPYLENIHHKKGQVEWLKV